MSARLGSIADLRSCHAGCGTTTRGARPNWGANWLCPGCKGDAIGHIWAEMDRRGELDPEEHAALARLQRLIALHEAAEFGEPEQLDMFNAA